MYRLLNGEEFVKTVACEATELRLRISGNGHIPAELHGLEKTEQRYVDLQGEGETERDRAGRKD